MVKIDTINIGFVSNNITSYYRHGTTFATNKGMVLCGISFNNISVSSQNVLVWFKPNASAPIGVDANTFTRINVPASTGPVFLHCDYAQYSADQSLYLQASASGVVSARLHYRWDVEPAGLRPGTLECGWINNAITEYYKHNTTFATSLGTHIRGISFNNTGDADIYARIWFTPDNSLPANNDLNMIGPFLVLEGGINFIDFDYLIKTASASIFMKADTANKVSARLHYTREMPLV